ncbi:putative immunoglobulin-blocking virulence protein, partial [Mycoplasma flocculare]|uniref:putative immunoglobulin-blocking virulence protein n=1 Tax=Mesomycoplasma flocculare TaxID=2128 RepID=UPI00136EC8DB
SFYSPVTNSEFKPFENKKPKVDLIKPEIKPEIKKEIEKPEKKEIEKTEPLVIETPKQEITITNIITTPTIDKNEVTEIPKKVVETPVPKVEPLPTPKEENKSPIVGENPIKSTEQGQVPADLIKKALDRYKQGVAAEIKKYEESVKQLEAKVAEIERRYKEDFDKDWVRGKIPKTEAGKQLWKEVYEQDIDLPKYELNRDKQYLEELKRRPEKTSFTFDELKYLRQGLLPSTESPNVWNYENEGKNPVINRMKAHNKARTFNTPGYWGMSPYDISNGIFAGWDKKDVSSSFSSEIDSQFQNSIKVYEYTPNEQNEDKQNRQPLKVVELDANDNNAFDKFKEIMSKVSKKDNKVQALRIRNIGETHTQQNAEQIFKEIPEQIKTVSVFLNNTGATKSLRGLENKKLKELSIYTEINSLDEGWAINPNALKNVDFISFDYNNQATYGSNQGKIGGSIIFDSLRWEKGDDVSKINEGLSIVFDSKIEQRVFQGNHGGKGGWPTTLDFSDTDVNTFKGINFEQFDKSFNDKVRTWKDDPYAEENYTGFRKLKFKKLVIKGQNSGSKSLNFKFQDLNGAQFSERFADGWESPKVVVKVNGESIYGYPVYITGNPEGDAIEQLRKFIEVANGSGNGISQIYVESDSIKNQIGSTIGTAQVLIGKQANASASEGLLS